MHDTMLEWMVGQIASGFYADENVMITPSVEDTIIKVAINLLEKCAVTEDTIPPDLPI